MSSLAADKVLGTYELVEAIVLHLPPKRIFVLQRVCKTWRDLISQSKVIRVQCFLEANEQPVARANTLPSRWPVYRTPLAMSELLPQKGIKIDLTNFGPDFANLKDHKLIQVPVKELLRLPHDSILRRTLLTQPPCTALQVHLCIYPSMRRDKQGNRTASRPMKISYGGLYVDGDGLRIGRLCAHIMQLLSFRGLEVEECATARVEFVSTE